MGIFMNIPKSNQSNELNVIPDCNEIEKKMNVIIKMINANVSLISGLTFAWIEIILSKVGRFGKPSIVHID